MATGPRPRGTGIDVQRTPEGTSRADTLKHPSDNHNQDYFNPLTTVFAHTMQYHSLLWQQHLLQLVILLISTHSQMFQKATRKTLFLE